MPGLDGTGPRGMGSMTGGGRGVCGSWGVGPALRGRRISSGMGYGRPRRSYRWGFTPFAPRESQEQELDFLREQARVMRDDLEQIETRMAEITTDEK